MKYFWRILANYFNYCGDYSLYNFIVICHRVDKFNITISKNVLQIFRKDIFLALVLVFALIIRLAFLSSSTLFVIFVIFFLQIGSLRHISHKTWWFARFLLACVFRILTYLNFFIYKVINKNLFLHIQTFLAKILFILFRTNFIVSADFRIFWQAFSIGVRRGAIINRHRNLIFRRTKQMWRVIEWLTQYLGLEPIINFTKKRNGWHYYSRRFHYSKIFFLQPKTFTKHGCSRDRFTDKLYKILNKRERKGTVSLLVRQWSFFDKTSFYLQDFNFNANKVNNVLWLSEYYYENVTIHNIVLKGPLWWMRSNLSKSGYNFKNISFSKGVFNFRKELFIHKSFDSRGLIVRSKLAYAFGIKWEAPSLACKTYRRLIPDAGSNYWRTFKVQRHYFYNYSYSRRNRYRSFFCRNYVRFLYQLRFGDEELMTECKNLDRSYTTFNN